MTVQTPLSRWSHFLDPNLCSNQQVDALIQQYKATAQTNYTAQAQAQLEIIYQLCQINSEYAFKQIGHLVKSGTNHEFMNYIIPDLLAQAWRPTYANQAIADVLIRGMIHGQTEIMQCMCAETLVEARYLAVFPILLTYRNTLLHEQELGRHNKSRLFNIVVSGILQLNSQVDNPISVSAEVLWSKQRL
ncbi:MAG: hypothetical protein AB4042_00965 [Leptolyngbyaceae cyanobacterium]